MTSETKLSRCMTDIGMTSRRLAELSGVSFSTVAKLRTGERNINYSSLDVLVSLADVLNVPLVNLIDSDSLAFKVRKNMRGCT